MIVYISGKITGDPGYKKKFAAAEKYLKAQGHIVLNPAILPSGLDYEAYLTIDLAMIDAADAVAVIPGWTDSEGSRRECTYAERIGKPVGIIAEWADEYEDD